MMRAVAKRLHREEPVVFVIPKVGDEPNLFNEDDLSARKVDMTIKE
jgi:hypothetical protein